MYAVLLSIILTELVLIENKYIIVLNFVLLISDVKPLRKD